MDKCDNLWIYYITGTGNARLVSQWFAAEASARGIEIKVQRIDRLENISMPAPGSKNLIGFVYPTHGFNAAPIMLKFIASFPRGLGTDVFLMNTRAGMKLSKIFMPGLSGVALMLPAFLLWLKGYKCTGCRPVDMPSNWIPLHPGIKEKVVWSIIEHCEPIVRRFASDVLSGRKIFRGLYSFPLDLLISPIALAYYAGGRFFLSKTFIANDKCNNCGLCIRECPTSSISIVAGRPYWKLSCESCMRCLNHCPVKAIDAAHGMAVLFWVIFSSANAWLLLTIVNKTGIAPDAFWWKAATQVISIAGMVLITAALYRVMHYAMKIKPLRLLVRITSLTSLPFWRRYNYLNKKRNNQTEGQSN
jgi:Pyruvate/2-oxoacid:ferredoxin oxidoreductase delta subunit